MDTRKNERLIAAGIDTASALERMMGTRCFWSGF